MNAHAEPSAVSTTGPRRRRLALRRRKRNPYLDWLKGDLGSIADGLDLQPLRMRYMHSRYVDQVVWMEGKADEARRRYVRLRLITVVGAVIVPVLVGLNSDEGWVEAATVGLSLIVAVSAAIEQFFHFGERWQHYRRNVERLKSEGWRYFQLADGYGATHESAFPEFARRVEAILGEETDVFISEVTAERQQGQAQPGA
jgi:hypothetical protein